MEEQCFACTAALPANRKFDFFNTHTYLQFSGKLRPGVVRAELSSADANNCLHWHDDCSIPTEDKRISRYGLESSVRINNTACGWRNDLILIKQNHARNGCPLRLLPKGNHRAQHHQNPPYSRVGKHRARKWLTPQRLNGLARGCRECGSVRRPTELSHLS